MSGITLNWLAGVIASIVPRKTLAQTIAIAAGQSIQTVGIDAINHEVAGDVILSVAAGTFTEDLVFRGKDSTGNYTLKLQGTLINAAGSSNPYTATGGSTTNGATDQRGTITVSGNITAVAVAGLMIKFAANTTTVALRGIKRIIESSSYSAPTTTIYCAGSLPAAPVSGDTFSVMDWGTILTPTVTGILAADVRNIVIEDMKIYTAGANTYTGLWVADYSKVTLQSCHIDLPNGATNTTGVLARGASLDAYDNYIMTNNGSVGNFSLTYDQGSRGSPHRNWIRYGGGACFRIATNAALAPYGNVIDGSSAIGLQVTLGGKAQFSGSVSNKNIIRNNTTYGIRADIHGGAVSGSVQVFAANGTNTHADAASFGYIS